MDNSLDDKNTTSLQPVSTRQAQAARSALEQALSFHFRGETLRALKSLRKALELNPGLVDEPLTGNLARELTNLPTQDALKSLVSEDLGKELIETAKRTQKRVPISFKPGLAGVLLVIALITLLGMSFWSMRTGLFDSYWKSFRMMRWETQKYRLGGYEYYAIVPGGSPPEGGWPVVVALHGMGGQGNHMLPLAETFVDEGVVFIAPTFDKYNPYPKGPIDTLSSILNEVDKKHPIQARGVVLLGHSQGGSFAYRFSVYYPEQVYGVVTAGAPEFDAIPPARYDMHYVFTWGEYDWLQEMMLPTAFALRNSGFNVSIHSVAGANDEMTQFAVEKALAMLVPR